MAKLVLLELTNVSQVFGKSEYAMFTAQTSDNELVECGITYNLLTRKGFDTEDLDSLVGCTVQTVNFTDNRTGELVNPEDQIQKVLDGESRLVLFNSINANIIKSQLYVENKKDMVASTNAKAKVEMMKDKKTQQMQASLERLRARALAAAQAEQGKSSLDDDEEDAPVVTEPVATPAVVAEPEAELEF
jgi:hypothetical protein